MGTRHLQPGLLVVCFLIVLWTGSCQTSQPSADTTSTADIETKSLAPERVDIRGSIIRKRYDQGQVFLEVEGFPSQGSRYNRAFVLVLPTTQIINVYGQSISLSELQLGQEVAILLRNGGRGNLVGQGIARKVWLEDTE